MQPVDLPLLAIATGIGGSFWASGAIAAGSLLGIPSIKTVPESSARAWRVLFLRGASVMPPLAIIVSLSFSYAAYDTHRQQGAHWKGFAAAAALVVSIVPFTLLTMAHTNAVLMDAAAGTGKVTAQTLGAMLDKWSFLNYLRSVLPLAAAFVGLATYSSNVQ